MRSTVHQLRRLLVLGLVFHVLLLMIQGSDGGDCTAGEVYNGHRYVYQGDLVTWEQAKAKAKAMPRCCAPKTKPHLVTITSEAENTFVNDFATRMDTNTRYNGFWIGLSDKVREGRFKWVTEEKYNLYNKWQVIPQQPDNIDELGNGNNADCAVSMPRDNSNYWFDESCRNLHPFVVEYDCV